ncbi:MAG TPA: ATP-binding protein [Anaeromyxobacteraceae bacterium]|nr:ATP-binding protein [Anaeromyxobacteraceae bacterium]
MDWRRPVLSRSLLLIMVCVALVPLGVAASFGYFQFRSLVNQEEMNHLRWHGERALHSLEMYLDSLRHGVVETSAGYTVAELSDQERLARILSRLKEEHRSFVDLSLVDPEGIQIAYAGPYRLAGKDYSASPWFNKTLVRKVHLSEVFMGFRNVPHFVIAASKGTAQGTWVVRASVDAETLDHYLKTISSDLLDDIFLVSDDGVLQSSSRYYGRASSGFALPSLPGKRGTDVARVMRGGEAVLRSTSHVQGTPWILVLERGESRLWSAFRTQLLAVSLVTALAVGLLVVGMAKPLANRIREAEEARESLIKESEHTGKLASIGRLAAGVAHEINNPLAVIKEKAGLMKDLVDLSQEMPHREKFARELGDLEAAVGRARVITHRLLGFARRMDVRLQQVQVNDVIREVVGFLDREAMFRGIRIEQALDAGLPPIESDTGQLQQIFLNIVNNAIDAVDRGGLIQIASRRADHSVRIDVRDDGHGIPAEIRQKIFEPFFTTKKGTERHGAGLGLSITYGLVKKLGGEISVSGAEAGSGTVFTVTFPLPPGEAGSGQSG